MNLFIRCVLLPMTVLVFAPHAMAQFTDYGSCLSNPLPATPETPNYLAHVAEDPPPVFGDYDVLVWRHTCNSDSRRSVLLFRFSPSGSSAFVQDVPLILQNGRQYAPGDQSCLSAFFSSAGPLVGNFDYIEGPLFAARTVFYADPYCSQPVDVNAAMTIIFGATSKRVPVVLQIPAKGASGAANFTLTVLKTGTGSGNVQSTPSGISCGAACAFDFPPGALVTLVATASQGSTFEGWSGGGCGSAPVCLVAMTAATSVTASFKSAAPASYTLQVVKQGTGSGTVTSSPAGISCGATCTSNFGAGTAVTLTAVGAAGSTFSGWSGAGCGTSSTCSVTMDAAATIFASFSLTGPGVSLPAKLSEEFDGPSFNTAIWSPYASPWTFGNGVATAGCGAGATTQNKFAFQGDTIVVEARMNGSADNHDAAVLLFDAANSTDFVSFGDTNYGGYGFYAAGAGSFDVPQSGNGSIRTGFMEYRLTLNGTSLKVERGPTLSNITETLERTLKSSISGRSFYFIIGTNQDYCPTSYDWIRVRTSQSGLASTDNMTGLWWNPGEAGWGINLNQQGTVLFATLFSYSASGSPLWLVMSSGARQADGTTFVGDLSQTTGPAFNAIPFTPISSSNVTNVGTMSVAFASPTSASLSYTFSGATVTKHIEPQVFGPRAAQCQATEASRASSPNYQDLWWNPSEAGWGVNVAHQGDVLFATLFTYDGAHRGVWYVMSSGVKQADGSYLGNLYRTTGPAFNAQPFAPISAGNLTKVGTMQFRFSDGQTGTLAYSVDGAAVTKSITRQVFSSPVPACQ